MNSVQSQSGLIFSEDWATALRNHNITLHEYEGKNYWEIPHGIDTQYLSHSYFRYIGKFPPQIARLFVRELSPEGGIVIDAMCGGGTTLTECVLSGRHGIGFDINPVSRQVSRTVSKVVDPDLLASASQSLLETISPNSSLFSHEEQGTGTVINLSDSDHFFSSKAKEDLSRALLFIESIDSEYVKDFLMTAVMSVLRQISLANVKKMNVVVDETKRVKNLHDVLSKKLEKMLSVNNIMSGMISSTAEVFDHDATKAWPIESGYADLVVLHPPYLTNTAYSEFTRLQLALMNINHKTIWKRELRNRGSYMHEPNGLKKYLVGWNNTLKFAFDSLKEGGRCAVVVGDGKIEFARIPVGKITEEFGKDHGFKVSYTAEHILNNNTGITLTQKMKGQHVIILRK